MTSPTSVKRLTSNDLVPGKCYCHVGDVQILDDTYTIFGVNENNGGIFIKEQVSKSQPFLFIEKVQASMEPIQFWLRVLGPTSVGYIFYNHNGEEQFFSEL